MQDQAAVLQRQLWLAPLRPLAGGEGGERSEPGEVGSDGERARAAARHLTLPVALTSHGSDRMRSLPLPAARGEGLETTFIPTKPGVPYGTSTAAPSISPARSRRSASFACASGKASVVVRTGTFGARSRNSSPSRRVRLATERRTRSSEEAIGKARNIAHM